MIRDLEARSGARAEGRSTNNQKRRGSEQCLDNVGHIVTTALSFSAMLQEKSVQGCRKQKQKYRGMFETQKSRNKTSSGDIGLNIRPKTRYIVFSIIS